MDPNVCGKLLTHHQRCYGVDVEAFRDRIPSGGAPEKAPRWDLTGTEGCGGGNRVFAPYLMFPGYMSIYRRKRSVRRATRGPRGWGRAQGAGAPPCLVASSFVFWRPLQVLWITFVPKTTFPKVSFRLDSVWYSFPSKHWNRKKTAIWAGPPVNRLVPKII